MLYGCQLQERKPLPVPPKKIIAIVSPDEAAAAAADKAAVAPSKPSPAPVKAVPEGTFPNPTCTAETVQPVNVLLVGSRDLV